MPDAVHIRAFTAGPLAADQGNASLRQRQTRLLALPQAPHWMVTALLLAAAVVALGLTVQLIPGASTGRTLARIDPNSLRRAILALVDNALAHTPPGGTIALATAGTPRSAVITVTDTGSGITGVERDRIFERFVRTPRVDGAPGHRSFGIGLALVRDVVSGAGGTVEIAGTGPQGTTMKISLPLASA